MYYRLFENILTIAKINRFIHIFMNETEKIRKLSTDYDFNYYNDYFACNILYISAYLNIP